MLSIRISPNNSTRLSKSTLVAAIQNRDIKPGLILHSDRGSNFISYTYNKYLKDHHIIHSYSRPSTPTDNAPLESFNRTLKDMNANMTELSYELDDVDLYTVLRL